MLRARAMAGTQGPEDVSPNLLRIADPALSVRKFGHAMVHTVPDSENHLQGAV